MLVDAVSFTLQTNAFAPAKRGAADRRDGFALADRVVRHHPVARTVFVEQRAQALVDITFYCFKHSVLLTA